MFIINKDLVPWRNEGEIPSIIRVMQDFLNTERTMVPVEFYQIHKFISVVQKLEYT